MHENIEFLQAFLKNPFKVGAIAPSSAELSKKMLVGILPSQDSVILELGAGTGAVTKFVQKLVKDEKSYLGIELDKNLFSRLKTSFPELRFVRGNACKASALHKRSKLGKVEYIVSGLPFASLPTQVSEMIFGEIEKFMDNGCIFRTFQYAHGYYLPAAIKMRQHMRKLYGPVERSQMIVKNVPPAYTLTWRTK